MNNQKGMTLIEVMVAMLVLSIAMIGGISFFTSAYRINYSYLESANRLDHALRYVEKLKVQRRDYPTFGAFANIGGNGFTAFFIDSEFNDDFSADPYFYENYFSGTIRIPATFTLNSLPALNTTTVIPNNGSIQPRGYYYWGDAAVVVNSSTPIAKPLIKTDYPNNDYQKYRLSAAFEDAYAAGTALQAGTTSSGVADYYLNYHYDGVGTEDIIAYSETTFAKMAKYSRDYKYFYIYDNSRYMYKYTPRVDLSQMFVVSNSMSTFPAGVKYGAFQTPSVQFPINGSYPHYYIAPYSYITVGTGQDIQAKGWYSGSAGNYTSNPILLKNGTLQENTGESSSVIGKEGTTFIGRRFYRQLPSMSLQDEITELRDNVQSVYTTAVTKDYIDTNKEDLKKPDPVLLSNTNLYHRDAKYVALVYKGNASEKEQIHSLYSWNYSPGSYVPSGVISAANGYLNAYFSLTTGGTNNHRVTRVRRSVYVSVWPYESDAVARASIRNAINSSQDFNDRVNYIKNKAAGKQMIIIPFLQLYAENEQSTLCEAL